MTAIEPTVQKTARYSVTETSKLLGIHRNTLTRYTIQGLIKCGYRASNARKFYKGIDILAFWSAQM